ncbi:MAG: RNase adapter RapZ [Bdellovibrionota bacterium]
MYIDSSDFLPRDLRQYLVKRYTDTKDGAHGLGITIMSFGFKYGVPLNSDLLIDVRFIKNPFFEKDLKSKTGLDQDVQDFVMQQPETMLFLDKMTALLDFLIPLYEKAGKSYLQLSIGCTGGQHRSVAIAECLGEKYKSGNQQLVDYSS